MFHSRHTILFLTKGIAHVTLVHTGGTPSIHHTVRFAWESQQLPAIFSKIQRSFHANSIRILLADEFSYVLELPVPESVRPAQERAFIQQQLATHIPETLHAHDWDYKEIPSGTKDRKVLLFAPVNFIYNAIFKASQISKVHVEAIEPVSIASKRHANAVIGIALKKDLKGKDSQVLNVIPQALESMETPLYETEENKKGNPLLVTFLILVIFLVPASGAWFYLSKPAPSTTEMSITPSPVLEESEPSPEPTETPTPEVMIDFSRYSVMILNGSGVPGASSEIRGQLIEKGFKEVTIGNADSREHTDTIIRKKGEIPAIIIEYFASLLSEYTINESDPLTSSEPYDVLIIVGERNE